jgi:indole-3-glycerol phosphate synthase
MSEAAMNNAAASIRSAQATMASAISVLTQATAWSGADSDRFERDWQDQVSTPLLNAAAAIDGASFTEIGGGS